MTKKTKQPKKSEIVLRAAERIELGQNVYSCCALWEAGDLDSAVAREYSGLFAPRMRATEEGFWLKGEFKTGMDSHEAKEWRLTALCLFAAMLEAEGE